MDAYELVMMAESEVESDEETTQCSGVDTVQDPDMHTVLDSDGESEELKFELNPEIGTGVVYTAVMAD